MSEKKLSAPVLPTENTISKYIIDLIMLFLAGSIVAVAYFFFQNSNGFAPGGVGGLATISYTLFDERISWTVLMLLFNIPIFVLVSIFVNRKLGIYLSIYMFVQSLGVALLEKIGAKPYSLLNNGDDFEIVFACIATGVISGLGFSIMLKRFGASGGTYAISAIIKHFKPASSIAYISFLLDASVVAIAFPVYGWKITPVICTLLNVFIANVVVDNNLAGVKNGYKFEIITDSPDALSKELMAELRHGVTQVQVLGMYSHTDKYMLVCIIRKKQIGQMIKILKRYPGTFSSFTKVNEVFGRFKK